MTGVFITEENEEFFLGAVDTEALVHSDIFFGAVDEDTDTAVGVLAAEAVGGHVLSIRYIYVDDTQRRKGAGRELIETLLDTADDMEAEAVICPLVRSEEEYGIRELLLSCGFFLDEADSDETVLLTYDMSEQEPQG